MSELANLLKRFPIPIPSQIDLNQSILLIQQQQDLRLIMGHHLQKIGFTKIVHCTTGPDAISRLQQQKDVQAIFCDYNLAEMGITDLISEIKNEPILTWAPMIVTMESASQEKLMQIVETGAEEILAKPFTLGDIMPKVKTAFSKFHNPKNPEKIYELAKIFLKSSKLDEATQIYQALTQSAATSARPWVGLARTAIAQKRIEEAYRFLDEGEKRNEKYVHLFTVRGQLHLEEKDWDRALACFTHAISLSPLNSFRYKQVVELLIRGKKYAEMKDLLEQAIARQVTFNELYHYLSQAYFYLNDFKNAVKYIKTALSKDPENIAFLNQLGISYKELGAFDEAQKTYNSVIKMDPNNIAAIYNKAILFKEQSQVEEAAKLLKRVLKIQPNFLPAQMKLKELEQAKAV